MSPMLVSAARRVGNLLKFCNLVLIVEALAGVAAGPHGETLPAAFDPQYDAEEPVGRHGSGLPTTSNGTFELAPYDAQPGPNLN
jgi:hypothetical protein